MAAVAVRKGSMPMGGPSNPTLRYEVAEAEGVRPDWGLLWGHGALSSMASESEGGWPFGFVPSLADTLAVTRFDARGHGTSDPPANTWPEMGEDMTELKRAWGRKKTILGGTSMGAAASLYAALQDPEGVAGLILATPPTCYKARQDFLPMYRELAGYARSEGLSATHQMNAAKTQPPIFMESEEGRSLFEIGWRQKFDMGVEGYCAALECAEKSDLPPPQLLAELKVPTLILAWRSDVQHPVSTAHFLFKVLPNASLAVASSWADVKMFESQMRNFIEKIAEK